jgi:hypothetical protein
MYVHTKPISEDADMLALAHNSSYLGSGGRKRAVWSLPGKVWDSNVYSSLLVKVKNLKQSGLPKFVTTIRKEVR